MDAIKFNLETNYQLCNCLKHINKKFLIGRQNGIVYHTE